ncbi:MAG: hypothetical protein WCE23_14410 [Candidatus Binatus sp.]|uniref:hypothetical protein n=1 Tax=Candidatus Binatus sp. TaxID=2811406 RepID=UPI003C787A90
MLKASGTIFAMLALAAAAALATPAAAQQSAAPQQSPWAMHAPAAAPHGTATRSAQDVAAEKGTPQQRELARKMVYAMYAKDFAALKQLIAPSTMKCIGQNQNFLDDRIRKQFALPISKNYQVTVTEKPANVMLPDKFATYPMPATHYLGIAFGTEDSGTITVNEWIGQENGHWYEAQPCPTELGMQRFAKLQRMRAQGRERAKEYMARVQEPLKSQLLALIAKRDNADAWTLCVKSLHVDFQTAHEIVAILAGDEAD